MPSINAAPYHAAIVPTADRLAALTTAARQRIEATLHLSHRPPVPEPVRQRAAHLLAGWWAYSECWDVSRDDLAAVFTATEYYPLTSAAIDAAVLVEERHLAELCHHLCDRSHPLDPKSHPDCPIHGHHTGGIVP